MSHIWLSNLCYSYLNFTIKAVGYFMTYAFIGESRSSSRLFLLSKIFLTWTYHKQKWLIQILGLKLSQNRSQDHFGTWYAHVKKSLTKEKKPGKNWLSIADQPVFDRKFDNKHTCTVRSWWNPIILNCISCGTGFNDKNDDYLGEFEVVCCGLRAQRYIVHSHGDRKSVFDWKVSRHFWGSFLLTHVEPGDSFVRHP